MSISDTQIEEYWSNLTNLQIEELKTVEPLAAKKRLALELVKMYHGNAASTRAEVSSQILREYAKGELSHQSLSSLPTISIPQGGTTVLNLTTQYQSIGTISYVKDLVRQGAIDVNFDRVSGLNQVVRGDQIVRVGKKNIFKLKEEK